MASLLAFSILPVNVSAEEAVLPSESNEGELQYGELVDYFVTAEKIPTHRMDTPANVKVITAADIEANHYQTLAEALSHVNGVVITGTNSVTLNGNRHVLILINGMRLNVNQHMYAPDHISDLSALPSIKMVDRIEIVKGGVSALYGTDAAGGVINIITKKGTKNETTLDINFGSWSRQNYEITNQGTAGDKFSWFLTGAFRKSGDYKYDGGVDSASDYREPAFSLRLDNQFDENNSLTLNVLYKSTKRNDGDNKDKFHNVYLSYNFKENTNTPGWFRYFNNYHGEYDSSIDYLRSQLQSTYDLEYHWYGFGSSRAQGFEYQNGWEFDKHKLIAGAEWHKGTTNSYPFMPSLNIPALPIIAPEDMKNTSVYLQDTISFDDKWTFVPGLRYDHNNQFGHKWSPKTALNYRADDRTKVYASWGQVFRAPSVAEWYAAGMNPTSAWAALGGRYSEYAFDEAFSPEKGHSEVIGFEHEFDENMSVDMNFFNTKMSNLIFWHIQDGSPPALMARSNSSQRQRGFDLSFRQKINDNFSYDLGYTRVNTDATTNAYEPNGYRLGVHYMSGAFKANLLGIMASGLGDYYTSGSYTALDFNTSYDLSENATIYARALNFTNKNYAYENANNHNPGRFFQIGAQVKF